MATNDNPSRLLPARAVRERFGGVSSMTLWRWVQGGILPAPIKINNRNYWTEADVNRVAADSLRDREAA